MNIYRDKRAFIGSADPTPEVCSVRTILRLAKDIRQKLGERGYLLDHYLSLFLKPMSKISAFHALDEGFHSVTEYFFLCKDVVEGTEAKKEHRLYPKVLSAYEQNPFLSTFHLESTRYDLLYALMADDFLKDALERFISEQSQKLNGFLDEVLLHELFTEISESTEEELMGALNLALKERFLFAPLTACFTQGFMTDLLSRLAIRDIQTNKQIFQLLLDHPAE